MMQALPRKDIDPPSSAVVVIPCLNEEAYIERTIAGFIAEPVGTVSKIVIADGGSTCLLYTSDAADE